jgi:hypothetical protein
MGLVTLSPPEKWLFSCVLLSRLLRNLLNHIWLIDELEGASHIQDV